MHDRAGAEASDEPDRVLRELVEIMDRLSTVADDAYEERAGLHARRDELRARAAALAATDESDAVRIRDRIAFLEARRSEIYGATLSHSTGAQTGMGGGIDPEYVHRLNKEITTAGGLGDVAAELARLRRRLTEIEGAGA